MKKLIILSTVLVLVLSLVITFSSVGFKATTVAAAETQKVNITYVRWSQPPFDDIYLQAAKDFMAKILM